MQEPCLASTDGATTMFSREAQLARCDMKTRPSRWSRLSLSGGIDVGVLAAVLAVCWTTRATANDAVRVLLASASTRSPSELANQTCTGLSEPAAPAPNGGISQPRIRLWDELHPTTIPVIQEQKRTIIISKAPLHQPAPLPPQ